MPLEFKSRLGEIGSVPHMHCPIPSCKRDLSDEGQWLRCRAHFVKDIRELERALAAIATVTDVDCTNIDKSRVIAWVRDLSLLVLTNSVEAAERLYKESLRTEGEF